MVLGHWLEMRAISQARGALNDLAVIHDQLDHIQSGNNRDKAGINNVCV